MKGSNDIELALKIHGELSRLIHPVTPESIRASRIKENPTLLGIVLAGIVSFGLFIVPLVISAPSFIQILGAAGLGITFHSLYTANKYLHTSTFNPRYNQKYIINYALGLFAGSILGLFGTDLFSGKDTGFVLTPNLLALVGGFSAEAVAQILQRIAETLVTLVRGSNSDKNKAEVDKTVNLETSKLAGKLTDVLDDDDAKVRENVEKLIKDILKGR